MVWGCFSYNGVGPIFKIEGTMTANGYLAILKDVMLPYAEDNMPLLWVFQQDNDPKHKSKLVTEWFQRHKIDVLPWPAQSPDLNPIENLWHELKKSIRRENITNKEKLWQEVQRAWYSIPVTTCRRLIDSMNNRCREVLKNKGQATKY